MAAQTVKKPVGDPQAFAQAAECLKTLAHPHRHDGDKSRQKYNGQEKRQHDAQGHQIAHVAKRRHIAEIHA